MIEAALKAYSERFNAEIGRYFPLPAGKEKRVVEAMLYSLANGGKRLRPFLLCESAALFGAGFDKSINAAMSVEMLHTYSLIHDDLPAMDDDDLRRGRPTCHKRFDEATAIIAGDGLLTYAFGLLAREGDKAVAAELAAMLADAAGAFTGMVAGQMLDLSGVSGEAEIKRIEEMKTGRLIRYAAEAGAVLGGACESERAALAGYSRAIGQAFQIADDILDAEGDPALVGKTLRKDDGQGKVTFVSLYGLAEAKRIARRLAAEAKDLLAVFGGRSGGGDGAAVLRGLADFIVERKK